MEVLVRISPTQTVTILGEADAVQMHVRFIEAHREHLPSGCPNKEDQSSEADLPRYMLMLRDEQDRIKFAAHFKDGTLGQEVPFIREQK